jgi:Ni/Fe-hydrogenase subunit HybB-like protein
MSSTLQPAGGVPAWAVEKLLLGQRPRDYVRSLVTPLNLAAGVLLAAAAVAIIYRFMHGIGSVTNLTQVNAWGVWKGFNVVTGVALGAGGYTLACAVYILGIDRLHGVVRVGVLAGFLAYFFAVIGLLIDVGQPWRIPYPLVYSFGVTSVLFEVAWCMCLYLLVLVFEFTPVVCEWLGLRRLHARIVRMSVGFVAFGVILSSMHQPSLGALFLMAPSKLHPLWYSQYVPVLFLISSVASGLVMVVTVTAATRRWMPHVFSPSLLGELDEITLTLGRGAAVILFSYLFLKVIGVIDGHNLSLLATGWGAWFMVELIGFVALPCALLAYGTHHGRVGLVRFASAWTLAGIVLNRLNVSVIALNWNVPDRYVPSAAETLISLALVVTPILLFRWVVNRLPVLRDEPGFQSAH